MTNLGCTTVPVQKVLPPRRTATELDHSTSSEARPPKTLTLLVLSCSDGPHAASKTGIRAAISFFIFNSTDDAGRLFISHYLLQTAVQLAILQKTFKYREPLGEDYQIRVVFLDGPSTN